MATNTKASGDLGFLMDMEFLRNQMERDIQESGKWAVFMMPIVACLCLRTNRSVVNKIWLRVYLIDVI
jgi:hypothetical protein